MDANFVTIGIYDMSIKDSIKKQYFDTHRTKFRMILGGHSVITFKKISCQAMT